jgi:aspartate-semialdehyde dehydrogenase
MLRNTVLLLGLGSSAGFLVGRPPLPSQSLQPARRPAASPTASATATRLAPAQPLEALRAAARVSAAPLMMATKPIKIGVVGVTGAVGQEIIDVLGNRKFPVSDLVLFASKRSAGKAMDTPFGEKMIEEFTLEAARACDVVFLAVSGDFALEWVPQITENDGPLVIDNSSAYRYDPTVPLVVPEINAEAARKSKKRVVANPNCTTAIALMALAPLHEKFGIKRCIMSTYQAASGAGAPGMAELEEGAAAIANGGTAKNEVFAHPLPFNVIPHIDKFLEDDYTKEERKVTWETRKIMDLPDLPVSCTCVRIPTLRAHAEAITIETEKPVDVKVAIQALNDSPGVVVTDDITKNLYPMPLTASKKYDVEVGRIRKNDVFGENGLDLFVCGDQLLRGAALNAVLIAEAVCD